MPTAIHCDALTRHFGDVRAVDGLSLAVPAGSIFAFLGPNGAGKTTTIHLLLGLIEPTSGSARVLGLDPARDGAEVRRHCGALLEHSGLYERMSAEDNLRFYGRIAHLDAVEERIESLLKRFDLWERRADPAGTWSRGMKQKLAIARVLLHRPSLVFLDEPTAGLDPEATVALRRDIVELGTTVFLTTHNLADVEKMATLVAVIQQGRLLDVGTPAELRARAVRSRVIIRGSVERVVELEPGQRVAPLVRELVQSGEEIEEVRREEASLEDVFLELVKRGRPSPGPAAHPLPRAGEGRREASGEGKPIFRDVATVLIKEWRELTSAAGSGMSKATTYTVAAILAVIMGGFAAVVGERFISSPAPLAMSFVCLIVLLASVSDSFAGERERHTLETLLASALPDEALLLGKILVSVLYGWSITVALLAVMLVGVNLTAPGSGYTPSVLLGVLVLVPLSAMCLAIVGVLLSLRATTVREAQSRLSVVFIGTFVLLVAVRRLLIPDAWLRRALEQFATEGGRVQAMLMNILVVGALDLLLLVIALARFKRSRLIALK